MRLRLIFLSVLLLTCGVLGAQNEPAKKNYRPKTIIVGNVEVEVEAEVLDSGKISLFRVIDFYIEVSTNTQPIIIKLVKEDNKYIAQLKQYMADCPVLTRFIPKTKFDRKSLQRIVKLYNNCQTVEKNNLYTPTLSVSLGAGVSFIKSSFKTEGDYKNLNWSYNKSNTIYASIALTPPMKKNISFGVEVSFSNRFLQAFEHTAPVPQFSSYERFAIIKYSQFTTGIQFRQYVSILKRIRPFYALGLGSSINSSAKIKSWEVRSFYDGSYFVNEVATPVKTKNGVQLTALVGAQTPIVKNFNVQLEFRFDIQPNQITGDKISKNLVYIFTPTLRFGLR